MKKEKERKRQQNTHLHYTHTHSDCHSYVIPLTDSAIYFFNSNAIYNDYYCLFLFSNSITSSVHKLKIVSINLNAHFVFHFAIALCAESFAIVSNSIVFNSP